MNRRLSFVFWAVGLLILFNFGRLFIAVQFSSPQFIQDTVAGAELAFQITPGTVFLPTSCYTVTWQMENIAALEVNGMGRIGTDTQYFCDTETVFDVTLPGGMTVTHVIQPQAAYASAIGIVLGLLLSVIFLWYGAAYSGLVRMTPHTFARFLCNTLFSGHIQRRSEKLTVIAAVLVLFILGVQHWLSFYDYGRVDLDYHDWRLTRGYWDVVLLAAETNELPFFVSEDRAHTDRFLGDPDPAWNPFFILAPLMSVSQFALVNTLIFYLLGFAGMLLLWRRYDWSIVTLTFFYLLFNFNGFITSHLSVGHFTWISYFAFPALIYYLFQILEGKRIAYRAALKTGFIIFLMGLMGGFHFIIWWVWLLILVGLFNKQFLLPVCLAIGSGALLLAVRFIPAAFALGGYTQPFRTGFMTPMQLLEGLVNIRDYGFVDQYGGMVQTLLLDKLRWWEFDLYVGLLGASFIFIFGIVVRFFRHLLPQFTAFRELDKPIIILTLFSMGTFYSYITELPLPLVASERATSRFFIVPLLVLLVLACHRFQSLIPRLITTSTRQILAFAVLWQIAYSLNAHSTVWSVANVKTFFALKTPYIEVAHDAIASITSKVLTTSEQLYVASFSVGLVVSLIALVAWVVVYRRYRGEQAAKSG